MKCDWKIRWTFGSDALCQKDHHLPRDTEHRSTIGMGTSLSWYAGDRREFQGEWPGHCTLVRGCVLHKGHKGGCAP